MRLNENLKPCLFVGFENVDVIGMAREQEGCWPVGLESPRAGGGDCSRLALPLAPWLCEVRLTWLLSELELCLDELYFIAHISGAILEEQIKFISDGCVATSGQDIPLLKWMRNRTNYFTSTR